MQETSRIPLPKHWSRSVRSAVLRVIGLAQFAMTQARGWAADHANARVRLKAENERLRQEVALLREEIRIKDARMARIEPHRRPQYPPTDRLAILELKAARHWSLERTARAMLVTAATVASWMRRIDEEGPHALVQLPEPVNKFPQFVGHCVRRLKTLCPSITANYPDHVWHVDLTVVPTGLGFWCARPWALVRGKGDARLEMQVQFHAGHKHLPIVTLNRTA